jgi:putative N6-adenine-specific DNA methylase
LEWKKSSTPFSGDLYMKFDKKTKPYFAQIAEGLESVGTLELETLGAKAIRPVRRGIYFSAAKDALYRINYCSRLCTRILAPILSFSCPNDQALYQAAKRIDWRRYLRVDETFAVFASTTGSSVPHSKFAGLRLKDAVVDQFRERYGKRPDVDPRTPDVWINLHVVKEKGTISIDTSGGSLHRRGYRVKSGEAPMQETVAAAMIALSGWTGSRPLIDPMCGSGTIVIEAAMSYCRIPSGYLRKRFGFQMLPDYDPRLWEKVKNEADSHIRNLPDGFVYASDIDAQAVAATRSNCKKIPHARQINVLRKDFQQIDVVEDQAIFCNPPYGIRMHRDADLADFYRRLGDFLKQRCKGSSAFVYFGNREMIKSVGLRPSWKKPLKNGGLDGRLVNYELY